VSQPQEADVLENSPNKKRKEKTDQPSIQTRIKTKKMSIHDK
jgi:hypothetical protein